MEAETMSDCESPPLLKPIKLDVSVEVRTENPALPSPVDAVLSELSPPASESNAPDKKRKRAARRNCAERIPLDLVVRSLTDPDSGTFPQGISPSQLDDYINSLPENQRVTRSRNHLHVLLWRETKFGHIRRLTTGRYSAPEFADKIETVQTAQVKETKRKVVDGATPPAKRQRKRKVVAADTAAAVGQNGTAAASLPSAIDSICETVAAVSQAVSKAADIPVVAEKKGESKAARPRRKRTKKSLGPEFVTFESSEDPGVCDYCLLPANKLRSKGTGREVLLKCKDCKARAHSTCIGYSEELAERSVRSPWQCLDCKTCVICKTAGDAERMLFCDACDKGYHMDCHTPEVQAKPSGSWICCRCEQEIIGKKKRNSARLSPTITNNNHHSATKPVQNGTIVKSEVIENGVGAGGEGESSVQPLNNGTKVESQQHPSGCSPWVKSHLLKQLLDRKPDYEILDVLTPDQNSLFQQAASLAPQWTVDNVVDFVSAMGFSDQAGSFKDQEIDGLSFLLLTRADILSRLSLRVGPALKLYQRVRKLQDLVIDSWMA